MFRALACQGTVTVFKLTNNKNKNNYMSQLILYLRVERALLF